MPIINANETLMEGVHRLRTQALYEKRYLMERFVLHHTKDGGYWVVNSGSPTCYYVIYCHDLEEALACIVEVRDAAQFGSLGCDELVLA